MKYALPPGPALVSCARRSLVVWGGGRGLLFLLGVGVGGITTSLVIAGLVGLLAFGEARRRGELVYLANLGVPPFAPGLVGAAVAAALEAGALLVVGAG